MKNTTIPGLLWLALSGGIAIAQTPLVAIGDSITEGVQSADCSYRTQPNNWASLIAQQMGVAFRLPLISNSPTTDIFSTDGRMRLNPNLASPDVGVSGATIHDVDYTEAAQPISTETSLVLEPRWGSTQLSIAQSLNAALTVVWIGNNDVDSTVLSWDQLDATQITPVADFEADYQTMIDGLAAMNSKVVVATIPDVAQTGFVVSPEVLQLFLGSDFGLPEGSYTTLPTMVLIKIGYLDPSILQNPDYVLDPTEIATIEAATQQFNQIITDDATAAGFPVVDAYTQFHEIEADPPVFYGVPLTFRFNGGLLSLDGFHPSDIGHALAANAFIQAANNAYGLGIPLLSQDQLNQIAANDPFIDWNGNLIVRGRPLAGLEETLGPIVGISGDFSDHPSSTAAPAVGKIDPQLGQAFKAKYLELKGLPASTPWTQADAIAAVKDVFSRMR